MAFDEKKKFDTNDEGNENIEQNESSGDQSKEYIPASKDGDSEAAEVIASSSEELAGLKLDVALQHRTETNSERLETSRGGDENDDVGYTQNSNGFAYQPSNANSEKIRADFDPDKGREVSEKVVSDLRTEMKSQWFNIG